ncbi:MAG: virulence RhuM family protein [Thermomonas sp.]|uniref:virulence RhuM family protein n=1 Tax=Thermomonas sp. TaxID=1971895 RepID=UPI0039E2EFC1
MSEQPQGEILFYPREDGALALQVRLDGEMVWLTQAQMADLFQTTPQNITLHLKAIYAEGELDEAATCKDYLQVRQEGTRRVSRALHHYNLEAIIAVGYRVKSGRGTQFRRWATEILSEYARKGFAMDDARLKNLGGGNYWKELLARIRDIRSSEKVLYRQVLDLYATSVDYDPRSEVSTLFFKTVQNKLHYAAHGHTAAEVIAARADAGKPFMGLLSFAGDKPTKADIPVAKNYLEASELRRLNTLVSAYFDAAEFRAENHEPTYMKDWLAHLDTLIVAMGGKKLDGAGKVSHQQAIERAESEYAKYRSQQDALPSKVEAAYLETVKQAQRKLEGKP